MRAEDVVDERDEEKTVEQKAEAIKAKRVEHIERRRKRRRVRVRDSGRARTYKEDKE